jgi:hypothetical protein
MTDVTSVAARAISISSKWKRMVVYELLTEPGVVHARFVDDHRLIDLKYQFTGGEWCLKGAQCEFDAKRIERIVQRTEHQDCFRQIPSPLSNKPLLDFERKLGTINLNAIP